MHPLLLPGTRVLRRDARHLQVGLDPTQRVVLPDDPACRRLEHGELLRHDPDLTARLGPVLLPDDGALRAALPAHHPSYADARAWARHSLSALARRRPDPGVIDRRTEPLLVVQSSTGGRGLDTLSDALAEELRLLCRRLGLQVTDAVPAGPRVQRGPVVRALVTVGEPARSLLDDWSEPHLLVRFVEGAGLVGPFVEPGTTACLRCVDGHLTDRDAAWPLLVEQYSRLRGADRPDGVPEPVDAPLAAVCLGWAARDLATHVEGEVPLSLGRTLRFAPDLVEVETQDWPPHPACGCGQDGQQLTTPTDQAEWGNA